MKRDFMFISESVTAGHPDKLCDQISDAIVDQFLRQDPRARVVTECAVSTAIVFIAVRFAATAVIDFTNVARHVIKQVGYNQPDFNAKTCSIVTSLKELCADATFDFDEMCLTDAEIEQIPVKNQATVFGFACSQTPAFMPLPIWLAHRLAKQLSIVQAQKILPYLTPDGKTQVGVTYRDHTPDRIHSITLIGSQQADAMSATVDRQRLEADLRTAVIEPVFASEPIRPDAQTHIFINPDGLFIGGGPAMHAGVTGRKTAIDTYGEYAKHSGAALSGKDPTRIDRVGAYAARYAAKNIVAAGLADECEVQLSYSIGLSRPVSIQVETFGTGKVSDETLASLLETYFDFRLAGIMRQFKLRSLPQHILKGGFYRQLAAYGHMGRLDLGIVPWEAINKVTQLQAAVI
jgi:S-adenosylmethionine synthetase